MKTTRKRRDSLIQWLTTRGGPLRGFTVTYGHLQPAIEDCNELEDGIRALAESLDNDELRLPTGGATYRQGVDNGYNLASQHAARKIYALLDD